MTAKRNPDKIFYREFIIALLLFIIYMTSYIGLFFYYNPIGSVYAVLFFAYVIAYVLEIGRHRSHALAFHLLFVLQVLLALTMLIGPHVILIAELGESLLVFRLYGLYFIFLIPLYFVFALAAYIYIAMHKKLAGIVIFAVAVTVSFLFFSYIVSAYGFSDEVFLGFHAAGEFLSGQNPYTVSIGSALYANYSVVGGTLTTNNEFSGSVMDYPALYFLSFLPFYLVSNPTLYNLNHIDLNIQTSVLLAILLMSMLFLVDRKRIMEFKPDIILFLAIVFGSMVSITTMLMLTLILISYVKIESRYAFIPIGMALSLQQQLWLPAALLLFYSLNNYGWKKGMRDIIGAVAVFLLINGYFIALNPSAFASSILTTVSSIIPFDAPPVSTTLLFSYGVTLSLSTDLVACFAVLSALLLLYWNRKELIPILSLLPFLFIFHSNVAYFTFYLFFLMFALVLVKSKPVNGSATSFLRKHKQVFYSAISLVLLAAVAMTYISHVQYLRNFDLKIENQSLTFEGNATIYTADIVYSNLSNSSVYFFPQGYSNNGLRYALYGILNESLIGEPPACDNYTCYINPNRLNLTGSSTYHLRAVINGSNESSRVTYMHTIFYSGTYIRETYPVQNQST